MSLQSSLKKITIPNLKKIATDFKIYISSKSKKDEIIDTMSKSYDKLNDKSKQEFDNVVKSFNQSKKSDSMTKELINEFKNLEIADDIINQKIIQNKKDKDKLIKLLIPTEPLSEASLDVVEKAIKYAKTGDVDNFKEIIHKIDIGLRYYLITNIPLNLKSIRFLFLGKSPFIFKSGYHYSQFTPHSEFNSNVIFDDKEIKKQFDKELEIVNQGKMKGFVSSVSSYALFNKDHDLLNKYHEALQTIMDDKLLEFIEDVFCKSVVEDDYELCVSLLKRLYNNERNKEMKLYLFSIAKHHKNDRMIKLFEDSIQNPV